MIHTTSTAVTILAADPEIDPEVFWPSVGIERQVATTIGQLLATEYGTTYATAMALLESGATLARSREAMA